MTLRNVRATETLGDHEYSMNWKQLCELYTRAAVAIGLCRRKFNRGLNYGILEISVVPWSLFVTAAVSKPQLEKLFG